jgi:hypothetical protein
MQESPIHLQLLAKLLSESPDIGSRLKLRLNAESIAHGMGPFNYAALGYRTFKDFLQNGTDGIVHVELPNGPGDLRVSLREELRELYRTVPAQGAEGAGPSHSNNTVRNPVWQAFCNPDTNRKRFLHVASATIRHFTVQEAMPPDIAEHGDEFLEITPIGSEEQLAWMRSFLSRTQVASETAPMLETILSGPYNSGMNAAFTQALGDNAEAWRRERVTKIEDVIRRWADSHNFPVHKLYVMKAGPVAKEATFISVMAEPTPNTSARHRAELLLQMLSEADIAQMVLPTILDAILKTTKR